MKYALIYTTQATREKTFEVVKRTGKTLDEVCHDLILKGIPLVTWDDLVNVSREAKVRASFRTLNDYTTMKNSIPFHGYRKKGRYNEFLGIALEKGIPSYGIVDIEGRVLSCVTDTDIALLKLLYPTCEIDGMLVKIYIASDEALERLEAIVKTQPGINFRSDPLTGEFELLKVNGYMHFLKRGNYSFNIEVTKRAINITARDLSSHELLVLSRDALDFIQQSRG